MSYLEEDQAGLEDHEELIFQCCAGDGDYLRITWDEEDPEWRLLWIEAYPSPSIRDRIRSAIRTLKGTGTDNGVLLDKQAVRKLQEFLKDK
jgi:hypothetical protein